MKKVKIGIIGIGNMGSSHYNSILDGRVPEMEVVAVADINPDRLSWAKETLMKKREKNPDLCDVASFRDACKRSS